MQFTSNKQSPEESKQFRWEVTMALRLLAFVVLIVVLTGCATPSTTFLVGRMEEQKNDNTNEETVVYRPETTILPDKIRLHLPWIEVSNCSDRTLEFTINNEKWYVKSRASTGTFAEVSIDTVKKFITSKNGITKILNSSVPSSNDSETKCNVRILYDAAPQSLRSITDQNKLLALLKLLVAERLPTNTQEAWQDQYDYDEKTNSLNILPGMRLRINHETPIVTDTGLNIDDAHASALAAPVYLYLHSGGENGAMGTWTPTLDMFNFIANDLKGTNERTWYSASGINELATKYPRFWRLYVPSNLTRPRILPYTIELITTTTAEGKQKFEFKWIHSSTTATADGVLNIRENFDNTKNDRTAFWLVGSNNKESIEKFNEVAKTPSGYITGCKEKVIDCFIFRYRAILVPEIPVNIQGELHWIEVGTTLRDIVQARATRRLRNYMTSPNSLLNVPKNDYESVGKILHDEFLLNVIRELSFTRRFMGTPVRMEPRRAETDLKHLLNIYLEMGDDIKWQY